MEDTFEPCPGERDHPSTGVAAVDDREILIKVVELRELVTKDEMGKLYLTSTAIKKNDLAGKQGRAVSTLRSELIPPPELERRSKAINQEPAWSDDPLLALALTSDLRLLKDGANCREICVHAEPTTDVDDKLGACETHAGIKRSCAPPDSKSRLEWAVLRGAVARKFAEFKHACTGNVVTNGFEK